MRRVRRPEGLTDVRGEVREGRKLSGKRCAKVGLSERYAKISGTACAKATPSIKSANSASAIHSE